MKLHVEVEPGGRGPHLLLVHGFLSSRAQWRPSLAALKQHVRPVIVELWGHGRSPVPEDPAAYRVTSYVDAFEAIRRDLGVDRWLVCGQSFGAGLTIRYAHSHPVDVIGQIFTNSVSALSAPGEREGDAKRLVQADVLEKGGRTAIEALRFHPCFSTRFASEVKREMLEYAALIQPAAIANAIRYTAPALRGRLPQRADGSGLAGKRSLGTTISTAAPPRCSTTRSRVSQPSIPKPGKLAALPHREAIKRSHM